MFESRRQLAKIGKPRGSQRVADDSAHRQRLLRSADERHQFSGRRAAAAAVRSKMDDAPNYGNTGATIGHELTHGFDDEGRQFDAKGNLKDWWTMKDADEFGKRATCVSDRVFAIHRDRRHQDQRQADAGRRRRGPGRNFAGVHGLEGRHQESDVCSPIDGLTPDQRFFIGMAQWACGDERPESKRVNAITNPHSPEEYRINGVVSNMPEFGKAFACRAGQPMVRTAPCRVW